MWLSPRACPRYRILHFRVFSGDLPGGGRIVRREYSQARIASCAVSADVGIAAEMCAGTLRARCLRAGGMFWSL